MFTGKAKIVLRKLAARCLTTSVLAVVLVLKKRDRTSFFRYWARHVARPMAYMPYNGIYAGPT